MARTIIIQSHGGPEVMELVDRPVPAPGAGQISLAQHAIGLNYIDTYHRSGLYPLPLPTGLGSEAAGIVTAIGEGVTHLNIGDRVAYAAGAPGAYTEARTMPAAQVVRLPDGISFETAAAMMLKGLTTHYLFRRTVPITPKDTVLFHAAAGGVGLIACQWARSEEITLIATAGTDDKCRMALDHGATHAINYRSTPDFAARVRELTGGRGVDVVMDGVGKDTFEGSLNCLRPLGMMISFGNASGKVPPFDLGILAAKGSLKITRPTLFAHTANPETLQQMASELFEKVLSGVINIRIDQRFTLENVAEAHRALQSRATTGATVLTV
jgi:NADPH:quinone reductase